MLGWIDDAEDAVQEAWLRLSGIDDTEIANLDAWLTTVVARICLNYLRGRHARPPEELVAHVPDPIVDAVGDADPEHQAMLADAVGMALFVVLNTLPPAERLTFVLHDVFAVPFDQIAPIVERSAEATRKLASRARRRVDRAAPNPDGNLTAQHHVVDAFFAAGRAGDLIGWSPFWTPTCRCAATSVRPDSVRCEGHPWLPGWPGTTPPGTRSPPRRRQWGRGCGDLCRRPGNRDHGFHRSRGTDRRDRRAGRSQAPSPNRPASGVRLARRCQQQRLSGVRCERPSHLD